MADENMVLNAVDPQENNQDHNESDLEPEEVTDDDTNEEFKNLNAQLDQLNLILDSLEMKNDVVHAEFVKLLKSNREARKQFQESLQHQSSVKEEKEPDAQ